MKKKLSILLSVLIMTFILGACGSSNASKDYNGKSEGDLKTEAMQNILYVAVLAGDSASSDYAEFSEEQIAQYASYGITDVQIEACYTWNDIVKEFGACKDIDITDPNFNPEEIDVSSLEITKSGETLTSDVTLKFGKRDVVFELVYDYYDMKVTGISINPVYSLGEKMKNAGLNTVISLSIVFLVLILISLIIYSFNIFPYLEKKKNEKKAQDKAEVVQADSFVEQIEKREQLSDDTELIAVIAAAIAASEGKSVNDFVVRSINRR